MESVILSVNEIEMKRDKIGIQLQHFIFIYSKQYEAAGKSDLKR